MKSLLTLAILAVAFNASADQYKTVSLDLSTKHVEADISYPELFVGSVPAATTINVDLKNLLVTNSCDEADAADSGRNQYYSAHARIAALNQNYVGINVGSDYNCGGAYPNVGEYYVTYDAQTGARVEMDKEVPRQNTDGENVDWDAYERYQKEVAKVIYANLDIKNTECFGDLTKKEAIAEIANVGAHIAGLAKDKKVILKTSPVHAIQVCEVEVRVDFKQVKRFFAKDSVVRTWLK
jgi:hypothetical protein